MEQATDYLTEIVEERNGGTPTYFNHLRLALKRERHQIAMAVAEHRFWYVDIPRTSSSSIQAALGSTFGYPFGKDVVTLESYGQGAGSVMLPPHTPAYVAQRIIGPEIWQDVRTFSIVRHPVSWAVSLWQYSRAYGGLNFNASSFTEFLHQLAENTRQPITSRAFMASSFLQSDYLFCPTTGDRLVRDVLGFEDRDAIDTWMMKNLGIRMDNESRLMETQFTDIEISDADHALARDILARDFELLGYT
jgi:hypothetical protein